jgi:hypothetical protein
MLPEIEKLIETYFEMHDGAHIKDFQHIVVVFQKEITLHITHRTLKHVVEQRKKDGYSLQELKRLFVNIEDLLRNKRYIIIKNETKERKDFLLVETNIEDAVGVVLVLEIIFFAKNTYAIKTGFYRAVSKIKKLLKQK